MKIMKKTLLIFASAVMVMACKSKMSETANKNMVLVDTTGLYKSNAITNVDGRYVINDNAVIGENNNPMGQSVANAKITKKKKVVANSNYYSQTNSNESAGIPKDKGLSHAAKGTIVGAGTGAITGALINKEHRGTGAIIGALIGAGSGYVIGRVTDKKTGRVDRARARRQANQ
jgi:hypothetical protein